MPLGTMNLAENVEVQNSGKTFHVGKVTGSGALGGSCTFSNGASVGANTWQVGNDDNWSTSTRVVANANFVKVGEGRVTWNGKSTNTGSTTVREGELLVGTSASLGTGALTVGTDGTLSGNNPKGPLTNSTVTVDGLLRPGINTAMTTGTLAFAQKNVTISETGTLQVTAGRCATDAAYGCTAIEGVAKLTINGTLRIVAAASNTLQVGDSIRIFSAASFEGQPTLVYEGGIAWDTTRLSEGLLFVKAIAKPGDVNGDGTVDVADVSAIVTVMAGESVAGGLPADVNGDGTVDVADISAVITIMAENARRLREI